LTAPALTPLRRKWGLYICHCGVPEKFAADRLEALGAVVQVASGPDALPAFAQRLRGAFAEQVLFGCECTPLEQLEAACEAVGIAPELHPLALRSATRSVTDPAAAAEKALRLVLGVAAGLDARPPVAQNLLTVTGRVALFADRSAGLELARRLQDGTQLVVFLEGEPAGFGPAARAANWGRAEAIAGRLGAFEVTVAPVAGSDFRQPQRVVADQVVVIGAAARDLRTRTGLHALADPAEADLQRTAEELAGLTGNFSKPELLRYDAAVCAGGAADQQACGRCIPACPYDAVHRDAENPLRVRVDHLACEGCGACSSACPTSALRFTEPAPEELYARLAALLAPLGLDGIGQAPAVLFHCERQGQGLLDWAAAEEVQLPARLLPVPVPCLRYVSDAAMLAAVRLGAAGVGLLGCEACPHGERTLLHQKLAFSQQVLDAFGLGGARVRLLTVDAEHRPEGAQALQAFAAGLGAERPLPAGGRRMRATGNREVLADAIDTFIAATGRQVGGIRLDPEQPFARADVNDRGCTLCRACATVCPTHAFAFDMEAQVLRFKQIACVNCGLCAQVCPEHVITLRHELYLERDALNYLTVAQDEMVHCARCDKPFINRRAMETIQSRLRSSPGAGDVYSGERARLLGMCPDCRAVAALQEMDKGWTP
jgi:ferredoxin